MDAKFSAHGVVREIPPSDTLMMERLESQMT